MFVWRGGAGALHHHISLHKGRHSEMRNDETSLALVVIRVGVLVALAPQPSISTYERSHVAQPQRYGPPARSRDA